MNYVMLAYFQSARRFPLQEFHLQSNEAGGEFTTGTQTASGS
jgi:hypothetical protein